MPRTLTRSLPVRSLWTTARFALGGAIVAVALTACTPAGGVVPLPTPVPTPTVTVTSTATATPAPVAAASGDPVTPLSAWTGCAAIAQRDQSGNAGVHVGTYTESAPQQQNPDGTYTAFVPVTSAQGTLIYVCQVGGTLGAPELVYRTVKD